MLRAASVEDCQQFLNSTQASENNSFQANISNIIASDSPDFPLAIRHQILSHNISPKLLNDISKEFVRVQTQALGKIVPQFPDSVNASLIYLPIMSISAFAIRQQQTHLVVITEGLYELLRAHSVNSLFADRFEKQQRHEQLQRQEIEKIIKILNLSCILFMSGRLPEPIRIERHIAEDIVAAGYRLAEVALLFVILHEFGHVHFWQQSPAEITHFEHAIQIHTQEEITQTKIEEFYADAFVLTCLTEELAGPMIHASQVFFTIRAFIEACDLTAGDNHPLAINRLWHLIQRFESQAESYQSWKKGIIQQHQITASLHNNLTVLLGDEPGKALDELAVYAQTQITEHGSKWLEQLAAVDI